MGAKRGFGYIGDELYSQSLQMYFMNTLTTFDDRFNYTGVFIVAGTGTFGQVCLCREKSTKKYGAMKILAISDVIRLKQVEHVKNEKNILQEIRHPFIVNL